MGVFSEMAMDQFENNGDAPFQMDVDAGAPIDWNGQVDPPLKAVEPEPPRTPTTAKKESSDAVMKSSADEDRKAHEEAEAKRKAEWEAQQAAKKAAEQKKILQIDNMSDEEVMLASAKRVSGDTEKITRRNMKDCVSEVIQTKCLDDPAFARLVMHPRKSMVNCFKYITRKAWEYVQDELKVDGITPGNGAQGYLAPFPQGFPCSSN